MRAGRVEVDGRRVLDPEFPVDATARRRIRVDGVLLERAELHYIAVNKPRGLIVTTRDEHSRDTVYRCLENAALPWVSPIGRLDRASEGLLLFSNDTTWAAGVMRPDPDVAKTYHVQVARVPTPGELDALRCGVTDAGECLRAHSIETLRSGGRTAWLEVVLHGGRNRQIRRMLAASDLGVLRLVRTAIGPLQLGNLAKGAWRPLDPDEQAALAVA